MSKEDNKKNSFMYEMFGVGKTQRDDESGEAAAFKDPEVDAELNDTFNPDEEVFSGEILDVDPRAGGDKNLPATFVAPGTVFEGTLHAQGDVDVAGDVIGDIISEGSVIIRKNINGNIRAANLNILGCKMVGDISVQHMLYLNEGSSVDGNVQAEDITSSGSIKGDLQCSGNVTLDENARVMGNINTSTMMMAKGAVIRGMIEMREHEQK